MFKKIFQTIMISSIGISTFAQKNTSVAMALFNIETELSKIMDKKGELIAFKNIITDRTLVFRPNPIYAKEYFKPQTYKIRNISWNPSYIKMSRNNDWAVSTGEYVTNTEEKEYGQYLSIWKKNMDKWTLDLNINISHPKPLNIVKRKIIDSKLGYKEYLPTDDNNFNGKSIISSTELLLNSALQKFGPAAFVEFLNPDARLLFPGNEPILKKENILSFNNRMISNISLKTAGVDRANGGDLAYTYGVATIEYKTMALKENFNYVFVWECQVDHTWNIIAQTFVSCQQ